ncbi:MAG: hypothetical protein MRY83_04950, partial [Flavobacteriales bacterium]|nr:hypothetical protein [Flavobacteriales bacterium]
MFKFRFTILTTVLLNVFLLTLEGRAQFYNVFSVANAFSEATVVKSIPKGGFYLVSKTYNNASAQWVATIFRTNCDGSIGWTKSFTHQEVIWPSNLEILSDESILLSLSIGNSLSGQGNHRLMRLDEHGNHIWSKEVPRIGASLSNGFTLDDQENIYLLSSLKDSVYQMISGINVSKFDISGNLIWTKDVHGSKQITPDQIQINSQKEIVVGGDLYYGMDNIFIMVLDSTGNFITNSIFHTGFQTKCGSFVLDDNDNIHLTGQQDDDLLYLNIGPGLNVNSCFKYHFVQKEVGRSIIFY